MPSYSRPRVSDDNAFVEALFRTAKYRPVFPQKGFTDLASARQWANRFVHWYNHEHRHSGIRYVTPAQRHAGHDRTLLAERHAIYQRARERNPRRWSGQTRNWTPISEVTLNPERDSLIASSNRFSVRSEDLLLRPDLVILMSRRATKVMGGAEPPAATRSAASMARMVSTRPSPQ